MENPSCVLTSAESIWTKAGEAAHIKMAWIIGVWKRMVTRSISISETVTNASIGSYWPHLHFLSLNILECLSTNLVVLLAHLALLSNIRGHCHYRCPKIMNTNDFFSIMFWCTCRGAFYLYSLPWFYKATVLGFTPLYLLLYCFMSKLGTETQKTVLIWHLRW